MPQHEEARRIGRIGVALVKTAILMGVAFLFIWLVGATPPRMISPDRIALAAMAGYCIRMVTEAWGD